MKHETSKALYDYWLSCHRGAGVRATGDPARPSWRRSCPPSSSSTSTSRRAAASASASAARRSPPATVAISHDESFLALWSPADASDAEARPSRRGVPLHRHGRRRDGGDGRRRLRLATRCCFCRLPARPAPPAPSARWCASAATRRRTASARASSHSRCGRFASCPMRGRIQLHRARRRRRPFPRASAQNAPPLRALDRRQRRKIARRGRRRRPNAYRYLTTTA